MKPSATPSVVGGTGSGTAAWAVPVPRAPRVSARASVAAAEQVVRWTHGTVTTPLVGAGRYPIMLGGPRRHLNPSCPKTGQNLVRRPVRRLAQAPSRCPGWSRWRSARAIQSGQLRARPTYRGVVSGQSSGDPARHQGVQVPLDVAADERVDHPPGDLGVRAALLLRRVDVDAAQQLGLVGIQQGVVERLVRRDLGLVPGQVLAVLLAGQGRRRPPPRLAVDRPEPLPRPHHRRQVDVDVALADRPQVVPGRQLDAGRVLEVLRQPGHGRRA